MGGAGKRPAPHHQLLNNIIFSTAPLEADSLLWGSFWQGDVIAPGYILPALELCFLRESQLTHTTNAPTPQVYQAHLQNYLTKTPDQTWLKQIDGVTARCIHSSGWIIWLREDTIIGGYGTEADSASRYAEWVAEQLPSWEEQWDLFSHATRLDHTVQAHRAFSLLAAPQQSSIAQWLKTTGGSIP